MSKTTTAKSLVQIFELIELKQFNRATLDLKNLISKEATVIEQVQKQLSVQAEKGNDASAFYLGEFLTDRNKMTGELANQLGKLAGKAKKKAQAKSYFSQALKLDSSHPYAAYNFSAAQNGFIVFDQDLLADIKKNVPTEPLLPDNPFPSGEPELQTAKEIISKKLRSLESDRLQRLLFEEDDDESEANQPKTPVAQKDLELEEADFDNPAHQDYLRDFITHHQEVLSADQKLDLRFFLWDEVVSQIAQKEYAKALENLELLASVPHKTIYPEFLKTLVLQKQGQDLKAATEIKILQKRAPQNLFINLAYNLMVDDLETKVDAQVKVAATLKSWGGEHSLQARIGYLTSQIVKMGVEQTTDELFALTGETENLDLSIQVLDVFISHSLWAKVMELFEILKEENPNSSLLEIRSDELHLKLFRAAINLEDKGLYRKAIELYHLALRAKMDADCYKQIASCHALLGEVAQQKGAESQMRQVKYQLDLQKQEDNLSEKIELGKTHIRKKEYNKGIEVLKEAFAMRKTPELYNLIASIYRKLKWPRTLQHFNEQWRMHNNTPDFAADPDSQNKKS